MAYQFITYQVLEPHVALITLNRPDRMNALGIRMFEELQDALTVVEEDNNIYAYLITGAPRSDGKPCFSAGADMKGRLEDGPTPLHLARGVVNKIDSMLKPSIAVADGVCSTGGMELFMAADLRVAAKTASFFDWHLKRTGVGLGTWGASTRLPRLVGTSKAKEILLTGEPIDGEEAHRIGLVNRVYPGHETMEGALSMARSICSMRPDGIKVTMGFLETSADMSKQESLEWVLQVRTYMGIDADMDTASATFVRQQSERKTGA